MSNTNLTTYAEAPDRLQFATWDSVRKFLLRSYEAPDADLSHEVFRQAWIWATKLERQGMGLPSSISVDEDLDCITFENSDEDDVWTGELKVYADWGEIARVGEDGEIEMIETEPFPAPMDRKDYWL